jgi:hypothetical protein
MERGFVDMVCINMVEKTGRFGTETIEDSKRSAAGAGCSIERTDGAMYIHAVSGCPMPMKGL